ncbi:hypothetical protein Leryth_003693 [Lithospermum erythrorhizon]|nr:hypothetical protein Leryth_003693 [Lithospermum erythrorhizon]
MGACIHLWNTRNESIIFQSTMIILGTPHCILWSASYYSYGGWRFPVNSWFGLAHIHGFVFCST